MACKLLLAMQISYWYANCILVCKLHLVCKLYLVCKLHLCMQIESCMQISSCMQNASCMQIASCYANCIWFANCILYANFFLYANCILVCILSCWYNLFLSQVSDVLRMTLAESVRPDPPTAIGSYSILQEKKISLVREGSLTLVEYSSRGKSKLKGTIFPFLSKVPSTHSTIMCILEKYDFQNFQIQH